MRRVAPRCWLAKARAPRPIASRALGSFNSRAVAEISQQYVAQGVRCCLFTDQANPVSNHIYEAIGYRPVVDMVNLLIS